jgi:hypothetical protein
MTRKLTIAPLVLALALLVSAPAFAQHSMAHRGVSPLVGAWRMTSLEVGTEGNLQPVPYSGQIIFTKSGTMSVQAMNPDANAPATPYTMNGYEAYYGPVTIDEAAKTFVVTIESSLVRNLIGQSLTRAFDVSGDTLVLTPTDPAEGWRVTYERS